MEKNKTVEEFLRKEKKWKTELVEIRSILNKTELVETVKWGIPTYAINGKNVIGMAGFKNHFGLWFFQGVFLKDVKKVLINAQEGKTKGLRQLRFTSAEEIDEELILEYVLEAIQNQKEGKEVKIERKLTYTLPEELKEHFDKHPDLKSSFEALSPGKRKEYALYIQEAKQEKTKLNRLEKITPLIKKGVGLHDKYKNC